MTDAAEPVETDPEGYEESKGALQMRSIISDAFTFIRSMESNQAFAAVTLENLIGDQILRNGDSQRSKDSKYDPYSFDPSKKEPSSAAPVAAANYLGGSDTNRPTKLDRVLALQNSLSNIIAQIKKQEPVDVANPEAYTASLKDSV